LKKSQKLQIWPQKSQSGNPVPNFWCSLEVAAAELHLCFVVKGNLWWKRTFLPMFTIVVLHHKHLKLFKPFIPYVIAWSLRKGFNQSIRRTKEQKTTLQCLNWAMPKPVMPSGAMKSAKLLRRNSTRIWQCQLKRRDWITLSSKTFKQQH